MEDSAVEEKLLNPVEAASLLGIQPKTVYNLASRRVLPFIKIGGSLRFSRRALLEYIEEHSVQPVGA